MADLHIADPNGSGKHCTKCKRLLALSDYCVDRSRPDGRTCRCRECLREDAKASRAANPEAHRAKVRRWNERNRDAVLAYREENKQRRKVSRKAWETKNPDKVKERTARWRKKNVDRVKQTQKIYQENNREKIAELKRKRLEADPSIVRREGERRRQNPKYRLEAAVRSGVYRSLKPGAKTARTFDLLGYSLDELKAHLERRFEQGMSWDNYGKWHIDHIVPLSVHNFSSPNHIDFKRAWSLQNLRPVWASENIAKGAKIDRPFQPSLELG